MQLKPYFNPEPEAQSMGTTMPLQRLRRDDESGAVVVEMAISCLILLTVLFGVFEFTLASYSYVVISNASRQASRWAIVRGSKCPDQTPGLDYCGATKAQIATHVQSQHFLGIDTENLMTVDTKWYAPGSSTPCTPEPPSPICNPPGNSVQVTVSYPFPLSIPFMPFSRINLSSSSQMVISQ
jgi:Flp pilus assembly protein TadG